MPSNFDTTAVATRLMSAGEQPAVAQIIAATLADILPACALRPHDSVLADSPYSFDTLGHVHRLVAAGMTRARAEAHALLIWDLVTVPLQQDRPLEQKQPDLGRT